MMIWVAFDSNFPILKQLIKPMIIIATATPMLRHLMNVSCSQQQILRGPPSDIIYYYYNSKFIFRIRLFYFSDRLVPGQTEQWQDFVQQLFYFALQTLVHRVLGLCHPANHLQKFNELHLKVSQLSQQAPFVDHSLLAHPKAKHAALFTDLEAMLTCKQIQNILKAEHLLVRSHASLVYLLQVFNICIQHSVHFQGPQFLSTPFFLHT